MTPAEDKAFEAKKSAFVDAVVSEIQKLGHTAKNDDIEAYAARLTIDGTQAPSMCIDPILEGGPRFFVNRRYSGRIVVRVGSAYLGRGRTLRGHTWTETAKPIPPAKIAAKLVEQAAALKKYHEQQEVIRKDEKVWDKAVEKLRSEFPGSEARLDAESFGIELRITTKNVELLRNILKVIADGSTE